MPSPQILEVGKKRGRDVPRGRKCLSWDGVVNLNCSDSQPSSVGSCRAQQNSPVHAESGNEASSHFRMSGQAPMSVSLVAVDSSGSGARRPRYCNAIDLDSSEDDSEGNGGLIVRKKRRDDKGAEGNTIKQKAPNWEKSEDYFLLEKCRGIYEENKHLRNNLKPEHWKDIAQYLTIKAGRAIDWNQCKTRYTALKNRWYVCCRLRKMTGMTFNDTVHSFKYEGVEDPPEFTAEEKRILNMKQIPNYPLMGEVFSGCGAHGKGQLVGWAVDTAPPQRRRRLTRLDDGDSHHGASTGTSGGMSCDPSQSAEEPSNATPMWEAGMGATSHEVPREQARRERSTSGANHQQDYGEMPPGNPFATSSSSRRRRPSSSTTDSGLLGRMVLAVEDMSQQRRDKNEKLESRREQAIQRLRSMNLPPRIYSLAEDAILENKETVSRHHLKTDAEFQDFVLTRLSLIHGDMEVDEYLRNARRGAGN